MDRSIPRLLITQFLVLLARGVGFTAIMLLATILGVFRGLWEQSDFIARSWMSQVSNARMDSRFDGSMYWTVRLIALFLELVALVVLAHILDWFVELTLRM